MKTQFVKAGQAVEKAEWLALRLERSQRELDLCRRQLAQMKDLFDAHKRSEALLQGEKNLTEMIARGDSLEAMLEGSCRLVEEALPGSMRLAAFQNPEFYRAQAMRLSTFGKPRSWRVGTIYLIHRLIKAEVGRGFGKDQRRESVGLNYQAPRSTD